MKSNYLMLLDLNHRSQMAKLEHLLGGCRRKQVHAARDDAGPAGLMTGAQAGAIVAVEVLVEQEEIAPVGILLKLARAPVDRPATVLVFEKDVLAPAGDFLRHLVQVHVPAGTRRTLHCE